MSQHAAPPLCYPVQRSWLAGIAMAVIALLADQYCRAWQKRAEARLDGVLK